MKKLNRQEVTAVAHKIQENLNSQYKTRDPQKYIDKILASKEVKEITKLKSNSAVRKALELVGNVDGLDKRVIDILNRQMNELGFTYSRSWNPLTKQYDKYTYTDQLPPNYIEKIKRDITLEQLMCDDLQEMINKITKKYLND